MESFLTGPQLDKFDRVQKYLAISVPNEWRTLAELDHVLSSGAQLVRFPWDWVRYLKESTRESTYGLQMRLPSIASGQGKEAIALRFASLKFTNREELIGALSSPSHAASLTEKPGSSSSGVKRERENSGVSGGAEARVACVGTNTQCLAQGDALTEHIVRESIANQSVLHVSNSSGGLAKRFQRRADHHGGGGGEDDAEGGGGGEGGLRALDGGRSRLARWLTEAPLGIMRASVKTRRGIIETGYGASDIPLSVREGEEMVVRVQRRDDPNRDRYERDPYGVVVSSSSKSNVSTAAAGGSAVASREGADQGEEAQTRKHDTLSPQQPSCARKVVILSLLVNDMIPTPESASGVCIGPCDLAFDRDGQFADVKFTARKKGSYIITFKVTAVSQPNPSAHLPLSSAHDDGSSDVGGNEIVYECSIRLAVKEVFAYTHAMNHANIVKADVCDIPNAVQPGGVVLFRHDVFPLALPREYCLSVFSEASLPPSQQITQHTQKVRAALSGNSNTNVNNGGATNQAKPSSAPAPVHQMPRPLSWWWCDVSPATASCGEISRPEASELRLCASMAMEGAFLFKSVLDTSYGHGGSSGKASGGVSGDGHHHHEWDKTYRDADGNLDAAKVQRKLQEEARERAEKAKALALRRLKKKNRSRELTNTHLLNYGIDLRKPFRK